MYRWKKVRSLRRAGMKWRASNNEPASKGKFTLVPAILEKYFLNTFLKIQKVIHIVWLHGGVFQKNVSVPVSIRKSVFSFLCCYSFYIFIIFIHMMSGSKAPDFDAYGLFRATHSHNPTQYSHIVGLSSHFYAHIGAGPKVFHPPMSKLMWA